MSEFSFLSVVVALCFFLYGLRLAEESLYRVAGEGIRSQFARLTKHRIVAFFLGMIITIMIQSSTATIVMLIGFTSIGLIRLRNAIPVLLGADVGTTLLVLILASIVRYDATAFSFCVLIVGFVSTFAFRHGKAKFYARAALGLGFVFYGLSLIASSATPLRSAELVREVIAAIASHPAAALIFAALLTALVQSSAAIIGIILGFASAGLLNISESIAFVLGANLGSTVVPLLAGLRSEIDGRRLSFLHLSFKGLGVFLVLPFTAAIGHWIASWIQSPSYQVAGVHILFNLCIAALFLPLISFAEKTVTKVTVAGEEKEKFGSKYLDEHAP